jgi:hypothetical protein
MREGKSLDLRMKLTHDRKRCSSSSSSWLMNFLRQRFSEKQREKKNDHSSEDKEQKEYEGL